MINVIHAIIEKLPVHDAEKAELHDQLNNSQAEKAEEVTENA